jgi:SHS2 domain-containing protein
VSEANRGAKISFVKTYEILEHTADIRIRIFGESFSGLFINAAAAMFDILAGRKDKQGTAVKALIIQEAQDKEELFINWLNELLSLSAAKEIIFSEFKVNKLTNTSLDIECTAFPSSEYKINTEIKAATYHGLTIQTKDTGWEAEVVLDV